jgi:hypothetical protein
LHAPSLSFNISVEINLSTSSHCNPLSIRASIPTGEPKAK